MELESALKITAPRIRLPSRGLIEELLEFYFNSGLIHRIRIKFEKTEVYGLLELLYLEHSDIGHTKGVKTMEE